MTRRSIVSLCAALGAAALTACGSIMSDLGFTDPRGTLIPRTALFGNPERTQARISPDGRWISWLAPDHGVLNVWIAPAEDLAKARPLTADRERGVTSHHWTADAKAILFPQDKGGNENHHLYAVDIASGKTRDLTPMPDGARATLEALSPRRPDVALIGMNTRDRRVFDLYEVEIATGALRLIEQNPGFASWVADQDLTPRLGLRQTPGGGAVLARREADGAWRDALTIDPEDAFTTDALSFDADGTVVFMTDSRGRDTAALTRWDLESADADVLAEDAGADIAHVLTHPQTFAPIAYGAERARMTWTALDPAFAPDFAALAEQAGGDPMIVSMTEDAGRWIVHVDAPERPGSYYVYTRETRRLRALFDTRPALAGARLAPMRVEEITARDGLTLVSYLTLPRNADSDGDGRPDAPLPTVLSVHGGPWARDSYGYNAWHQWLADRGYAVLSVNYRGSRGFGKRFMNAAVREFAGAMHEDLIDAVDWAIKEGVADPQRVAIAGGSYGGYATLVGLAFTPERFACGVDIVGPSSLVTLVESFPEYWKPFLEVTWHRFVGDPSNVQERADMLARSPITKVDQIQRPLLIGQGANDPRVTKQESDQLVEAMSQKGLPVTYVNFPDEGHGFQRPENRLAFYAVAEGFLAQCLGGRAEAVGDAFEGSSVEILYGSEYVAGVSG